MSTEKGFKFSSQPTESKWQVLKLFCDQTELLLETKIGSGKGIQFMCEWGEEKERDYVSDKPKEEQIRDFLMVFRPFYLNDDPIYFFKVLNIIGEYSTQRKTRENLKKLRQQWDKSLTDIPIKISIEGEQNPSSSLINAWLYGKYFHIKIPENEDLKKYQQNFEDDLSQISFLHCIINLAKLIIFVWINLQSEVNTHFK